MKEALKVAHEAAKERRIICPSCGEPCCTIEVSDVLHRKISFECMGCLTFACNCCGEKFCLDESLVVKT